MSALKLEKMTRSFVLASTTSKMMTRMRMMMAMAMMIMIVIVMIIALASTTSRIESTKAFGSNCRPWHWPRKSQSQPLLLSDLVHLHLLAAIQHGLTIFQLESCLSHNFFSPEWWWSVPPQGWVGSPQAASSAAPSVLGTPSHPPTCWRSAKVAKVEGESKENQE